MAKLIDVEQVGGLTHKTFRHLGDDNKEQLTVQTYQDVKPIFDRAKQLKRESGKDFRFKAAIAANVMNEACYKAATLWGVSNREALQEIMAGKTGRAKSIIKVLSEGRDFRKFQAKNY